MRSAPTAAVLIALLLVGLGAVSLRVPLASAAGAITFNAKTEATVTSGTSITLLTPDAASTHQAMIAVLSLSTTSSTVTAPAGWSLALDGAGPSGPRLLVYTKAVAASESASHQWALGATMTAVGAILQYGLIDSTSPIGVAGVPGTGTTGTITAPAVTTTVANSVVLGVFSIAASQNIGNPSPAFDTRQVNDRKGSGAGAVGLEIHEELRATTGSFGPATATYSGPSVSNIGVLLVLKPPVASFAASTSSASESTTSGSVTVNLGGPVSASISVPFTLSGTATLGAGQDAVVSTASPLVFTAGQTSKTISFTVNNEGSGERDETIIFTLGATTNAELGTPTVHTYSILNDDARILVSSDPVLANGVPDSGSNWGAWAALPGATHVEGVNYLQIRNVGTIAAEQVTLSFDTDYFALVGDSSERINIDGNVYFASFQDTSPSTTAPNEGTFSFPGTPDGDGSITLTFSATQNYYYVTFKLGAIPDPLRDGVFTATITTTAVG